LTLRVAFATTYPNYLGRLLALLDDFALFTEFVQRAPLKLKIIARCAAWARSGLDLTEFFQQNVLDANFLEALLDVYDDPSVFGLVTPPDEVLLTVLGAHWEALDKRQQARVVALDAVICVRTPACAGLAFAWRPRRKLAGSFTDEHIHEGEQSDEGAFAQLQAIVQTLGERLATIETPTAKVRPKLVIPPRLERFELVQRVPEPLKAPDAHVSASQDVIDRFVWNYTLNEISRGTAAPAGLRRDLVPSAVEAASYIVLKTVRNPRCNSQDRRAHIVRAGYLISAWTLSRQVPLLRRVLDVEALVLYALANGRLSVVIPFLAALFEHPSPVFRPPCPWTLGILSLLQGIIRLPYLRGSLVAQIRGIFGRVGAEPEDLAPVDLEDIEILCGDDADFFVHPTAPFKKVAFIDERAMIAGDARALLQVIDRNTICDDPGVREVLVKEMTSFIWNHVPRLATTAASTAQMLVTKDYARAGVEAFRKALFQALQRLIDGMVPVAILLHIDGESDVARRQGYGPNQQWLDVLVRRLVLVNARTIATHSPLRAVQIPQLPEALRQRDAPPLNVRQAYGALNSQPTGVFPPDVYPSELPTNPTLTRLLRDGMQPTGLPREWLGTVGGATVAQLCPPDCSKRELDAALPVLEQMAAADKSAQTQLELVSVLWQVFPDARLFAEIRRLGLVGQRLVEHIVLNAIDQLRVDIDEPLLRVIVQHRAESERLFQIAFAHGGCDAETHRSRLIPSDRAVRLPKKVQESAIGFVQDWNSGPSAEILAKYREFAPRGQMLDSLVAGRHEIARLYLWHVMGTQEDQQEIVVLACLRDVMRHMLAGRCTPVAFTSFASMLLVFLRGNARIVPALAGLLVDLAPTVYPMMTVSWLQLFPILLTALIDGGVSLWPGVAKLFELGLGALQKFPPLWPRVAALRSLYKGLLRLMLLVLHDFPGFVARFNLELLAAVPVRFRRIRNVIMAAPDSIPTGIDAVAAERVRSGIEDAGPVDLARFFHAQWALSRPVERAVGVWRKLLLSAGSAEGAGQLVEAVLDLLRGEGGDFWSAALERAAAEPEFVWNGTTLAVLTRTILAARIDGLDFVPSRFLTLRKAIDQAAPRPR
jgi:hypothetical protein